MKKVYMFFAKGFEEVEALTSVDLLRRAGIEVVTVSIADKKVSGAHSISIETDAVLAGGKFDDADAIILPGGQPGVDNLYACEEIKAIVKAQNDAGKLVCAICAAPIILGRLGLVEGKTATAYPGCTVELSGAKVSDNSVCADGNIITSRGVGTAIDFALKIIETLLDRNTAGEVAGSILYNMK